MEQVPRDGGKGFKRPQIGHCGTDKKKFSGDLHGLVLCGGMQQLAFDNTGNPLVKGFTVAEQAPGQVATCAFNQGGTTDRKITAGHFAHINKGSAALQRLPLVLCVGCQRCRERRAGGGL